MVRRRPRQSLEAAAHLPHPICAAESGTARTLLHGRCLMCRSTSVWITQQPYTSGYSPFAVRSCGRRLQQTCSGRSGWGKGYTSLETTGTPRHSMVRTCDGHHADYRKLRCIESQKLPCARDACQSTLLISQYSCCRCHAVRQARSRGSASGHTRQHQRTACARGAPQCSLTSECASQHQPELLALIQCSGRHSSIQYNTWS